MTLFLYSLIYGLVLSLLLGILVYGSLYINPEIWVDDYPPDIRKKFGPIGEKAKRQRMVLVFILFPILAAFLIAWLFQLPRLTGGAPPFLITFLSLFTILMVFNVFDLLVLDWFIGIIVHPQFMVLPGTEGMAGYRDYGFPFRGFLKGTLGLAMLSLLLAVISVLVYRFIL
jgi:hypothetical protein